jgi:cysteine desulfurase / selenocysteine lyase
MSMTALVDRRHRRCFDWASTSPVAPAGRDTRDECLRRLDTAPDVPEQTRQETRRLDGLRQALRFLFAVPDASHVVFGRSVTEFVALLAQGLRREPGRGRVVVTALDHPALVMPWYRLAAASAVELVVVPDRGDGVLDLERLAAVVDEQTWLVASTHVSHLHGTVQPAADISRMARRAGAWSVVDGAQAVGRIPVDAAQLGCDVYMGVGRKALLAPLGTAFMLLAAAAAEALTPALLSTRSARQSADGSVYSAPLPAALEGNLPDLAAMQALAGCVDALGQLPRDEVCGHASPLLHALATDLATVGLVPRRPIPASSTGIASFHRRTGAPLPDGLQPSLRAHGFVVAADVKSLRLSVHLSNDWRDGEDLANALVELL